MKKIEEAAAKRYDSFPWEFQRKAFLAGARYVLDAMTSEVSLKAFASAVEAMDNDAMSVDPLHEIGLAFAAVRKEIEGE